MSYGTIVVRTSDGYVGSAVFSERPSHICKTMLRCVDAYVSPSERRFPTWSHVHLVHIDELISVRPLMFISFSQNDYRAA